MSLSMYDVSVPAFRQTLGALAQIIDKAEAHCASGGSAEASLIGGKLHEDMFPLSFQVAQTIAHSAGAAARLSGGAYATPEGLDTLAACKAAVAAALASLDAIKPADVDASQDKVIEFKTPRATLTFTGRNYLLSFALPNFYFHATTAYGILRNKGVGVGKMDFLGAVQISSMA